ncbi:MAG: 4'-phosphopantetheinyl transferase superfamily protein [Verrucomicrobia bacterium]|nr:4'-phosphopantetheinyl transferase superfamily protein [Verrucomicrobiota bacterium]MCH8513382.1 4'-phosphopantetheinyl transferase superfamily protein [Kiritimatiellia bacterium]
MCAKPQRWEPSNSGGTLLPVDREADWRKVLGHLAEGRTEVLLCSDETWSDPLPDCLSSGECEQAGKFRRDADRKAFVAGRLLMRTVIARFLEIPTLADIPIETGEKGKPFCPLSGAPAFNLSHTRGWLGLAIRGQGPVGVDLEDTRRKVRHLDLARRYFSDAEVARVEADGEKTFFQIWTRKEALVKCMGVGLTVSLRELDTFALEAEGRCQFQEIAPAPFLQGCLVTDTDAH